MFRNLSGKRGQLRRWGACVLLFSVVLRALIPSGYMPKFDPAAFETFKIVICSGTVSDDTAGQNGTVPAGNSPDEHGDAVCPFAFNASFTLADPISKSALLPFYQFLPKVLGRAAPRVPSSYSHRPFGPRAPPIFS